MKLKSNYIFLLLFSIVFFVLGYYSILSKKPQSIHRWRQSDSAAIAYNYYANDYSFLHPEVLYQVADGGKSGYTVSEFPGYYYLIAGLWKLFGHSDFIYRLVSVLFTFLGLFHLFKLSQLILKDLFWSLAIPFILVTSTLFVYYGNNFTTDVPAFSLTMVYCYYLYSYYLTLTKKHLFLVLLFVTFAGLLKVISLIPFLAFVGVLFIAGIKRLVNIPFGSKLKTYFRLIVLLFFLFPLVIIVSWYLYAINYNKAHQTTFFSTTFFPIWDMHFDEIKDVWNNGYLRWKKEIFNFTVWILLGIGLLYILYFFKKVNQFLGYWLTFIFIGSIAYIALWFYCFRDHDYYYIHLFYFVLLLLISALHTLQNHLPNLFKSKYFKISIAIVFLLNLYNSQFLLGKRYTSSMNDYHQYKSVHEIEPYLTKIGVKKTDKLISLPDDTPNTTLYLMKRKGWTQAFQDNLDSISVSNKIKLGATYLVLVGDEPLSRTYLQPFIKTECGKYKDVRIFKLK
jgi:hypothetical protein